MRTMAITAITLAPCALLGGTACSGGGSAGGGPTAPASATQSGGALPSLSPPPQAGSLKDSRLYFLTKLTKARLCGLLHGSEPSRILAAPTSAPVYQNTFGLGIICTWTKAGAGLLSQDRLYIGISTVVDWQAAQGVDALFKASSTTIDGHPALSAPPGSQLKWAQIDVALGGAHDPAVEFRAPTLAIATSLANLVTPRVLALSPSG